MVLQEVFSTHAAGVYVGDVRAGRVGIDRRDVAKMRAETPSPDPRNPWSRVTRVTRFATLQ
jgi:hypothetical protein